MLNLGPNFSSSSSSGPRTSSAWAVADINWFTTRTLFEATSELTQPIPTLLLHCSDYLNAWHKGRRPWNWGTPIQATGAQSWCSHLVLPSGWMKQFPQLGMRPIAKVIGRWRSEHVSEIPLTLVMTYPHYLHLRDRVKPGRTVYYNIDDYALYWPGSRAEVLHLEDRLVAESSLTVCVSQHRRDALAKRVPEAREKLLHLPHACPAWSWRDGPGYERAKPPRDLAHLSGPLLGYVGSLEDRVDWTLLDRLARQLPEAQVVLVGPIAPTSIDLPWKRRRADCLARSNVHHLGRQPQAQLGSFIRSFDICLIPYRTDHPFNLSCCPTKIMDYLGSGRPIVSTDLPECRLWSNQFDVAEDGDAFLETIAERLRHGDLERVEHRYQLALDHTAPRVLSRLIEALERVESGNPVSATAT